MTNYEFRAVPCPQRAQRHQNMPKGADAFSDTLTAAINDLAGAGWDYVRTDSATVKTRGFFRQRSEERTFLVFRREIRPLIAPRPVLDQGVEIQKVRARRVKARPAVEFVRSGGRRINVSDMDAPANLDAAAPAMPVTAAE
ncbi:MAG: hypothetical protein AAFX45_09860 [Pseudomonadota bacterium]